MVSPKDIMPILKKERGGRESKRPRGNILINHHKLYLKNSSI